MTDLFAILGQFMTISSGLSGASLASDRGNLSDREEADFADQQTTSDALHKQASERWAAATLEEIAAYDARVDALAKLERTDGIVPDAKHRAPATRSPARTFDAWAIWITMTLTAP